jgi:hypothetical protein
MNLNKAMVLVLCTLMLLACSKGGNSGGNTATPQTAGENPSQIPPEVFLTSENPGRWKDRKDEHDILVREVRVYTVGKEKLRELQITVSLQGTDRHYLEAALVLDHSLKKELAKISFERMKPGYDFKLSIPADNPNAVFVVIKCNQHDMWLKRLEPLPKKED